MGVILNSCVTLETGRYVTVLFFVLNWESNLGTLCTFHCIIRKLPYHWNFMIPCLSAQPLADSGLSAHLLTVACQPGALFYWQVLVDCDVPCHTFDNLIFRVHVSPSDTPNKDLMMGTSLCQLCCVFETSHTLHRQGLSEVCGILVPKNFKKLFNSQ